MPLEQQAALLRVLQEKQVHAGLGNQNYSPVDVRGKLCYFNLRDLYKEVQKGTMREDHIFASQCH